MIFLNIILLLYAPQVDQPVLHFFYRPSCGYCMDVLLGDIPRLQEQYAFRLKSYDIDLMKNYRLLEKMEHARATTGEDLPVIFLGDSVFYGPEEIYSKLASVLETFAQTRTIQPKDTTAIGVDTVPQIARKVTLYYFFQPGCSECDRLEAMFNSIEKDIASIEIARLSIFVDTNKVLLEAFSEEVGIPATERLLVPVVIFGRGFLIKDQITTEKLFRLITEHQSDSLVIEKHDVVHAEKSILQRFGRFSLLGIIIAGLLDGVNPCAFATIIFFISYLLFLGRRRRDIVLMAVSFITAVFIAYFLIGVGAYGLLKYLAGYKIIAQIIFLLFGTLAIILGLLSLRDYLYARRGELDKMFLQLPLGIKQRIHRDIKEKTAVGGILIGSFLAGLIISFLEFGCTGQIYLPTITFMITKVGWSLKPILSLLVYNIMFIIPLIVIAILAVVFTSQGIARSLATKIPVIKLLTAILFFMLGILLILSV